MGIYDYGEPTNPLANPSLSEWAADLAAEIGSSDAWVGWTPAFTGGTLQSATCFYRRTASGLVTIQAELTVATITGSVAVGLPATLLVPAQFTVVLRTSGGQNYVGAAVAAQGATSVAVLATGGTNGAMQSITPTLPFTWSAGATIRISGQYRT